MINSCRNLILFREANLVFICDDLFLYKYSIPDDCQCNNCKMKYKKNIVDEEIVNV